MDKTRELITKISKKEKRVKNLVKRFQSGEITEDDLVSTTLHIIYQELLEYRDDEMKIEVATW